MKRICDWAQSDENGGIIEYQATYGTCSIDKDGKVWFGISRKKVPKPWFTGRRTGFAGLETIPGPAFATFEEAMEYMKTLGYTFKHWRAMLPSYVSNKAIKDFDSRCTVF